MCPCASPFVIVKISLAGAGAYPERLGRADDWGLVFLTGDWDVGRERDPAGRGRDAEREVRSALREA
jgi:hypothetical protein